MNVRVLLRCGASRMTWVMMAMVVGPHKRGASRGTQITAAINIAIKTSRTNNAGFLEKEKSELTTKERGLEGKFVTYQTENSGELNNRCPSEMPVLLVICVTQQSRYNQQRNRKQKVPLAPCDRLIALISTS